MRVSDEVQEPGWMVEELVRKLSGFFSVSDGTAKDLVNLCSEVRSFEPKERISA